MFGLVKSYMTMYCSIKIIIMKKIYILLIISLVFGFNSSVFAGDDGEKVGGIRFGYHASNFYKDGSVIVTDPLQSFYVGFAKEKKIMPMLSFGSGLEYFQNGTQFDSDNKRVLHYLSVPLSLKFKLGPVYALGGFAANFKVAEKVILLGESIDVAEKSEWFDAPAFLGLGAKILFLSVEARYGWGMLEVNDGYKSQYFQLGLGVSF